MSGKGPNIPSDEELAKLFEQLQKELSQLEANKKAFTPPTAQAAPTPTPTPEKPKKGVKPEEFKKTPKEVKAFLDRFVIRQDEAKKVLSVALCDHYNHIRMSREGKTHGGYAKQNVILLGPTGVGKTYLVRSMAELIGVPFVKGDATKFSETGYIGADVEDLVRSLIKQANGDVELAQYGIIYIDEIDKIATATNTPRGSRDVSGRGVQTNLLKLMEETDVPTRAVNDMSGQFEMMMRLQDPNYKPLPPTINTRNILFIVSGAFDGLDKIIDKRLRESRIGFSYQEDFHTKDVPKEDLFDSARTEDFIRYGFEPEFIGRLPVRVVCKPLTENDLYDILKSSEGSITRQYEESFGAYGIEILFEDKALHCIAKKAAAEQTGARGLMTVCERVFRDYKYELPGTNLKRFVVTESVIEDPQGELKHLLAEGELEKNRLLYGVVDEFAERFTRSYGIGIRFTDSAKEMLINLAQKANMPVREYCGKIFKDFQFGLKLLLTSEGKESGEFLLDEKVIESPEAYLSERLKKNFGDKVSEKSEDLPPPLDNNPV